MVRLRGHHLICLQFFRGEGYSREFVRNLEEILYRLSRGEEVEIAEGADEVCSLCPFLREGKCTNGPEAEAKVRARDASALAGLGLRSGDRVEWPEVKRRFRRLSSGWLRELCQGCEWQRICLGSSENKDY
ncbi:protein of unknown function DUF1284 [Ammonifex degensii KC4]|uniref:DUF1284 domain-containing protein n=1 Tax=Ammonifex degensii (strain DSM 10501 / KC4) TaxID=429009 RepID=C9RCZ8_AMMDK|nr:DUF1284 domain-containing protein [Ammonifex degensii]ACX52125.1 protein of unknown function DUF1284 [Ammonifex degensii KC4]